MSWKDKLFTLINTRFYTKEEIDSKATVVFINPNNFRMGYNGNTFESTNIEIIDGRSSCFLAMELPFGRYDVTPSGDMTVDISQDDEGVDLRVNQKFMFIDAHGYFGEPQE